MRFFLEHYMGSFLRRNVVPTDLRDAVGVAGRRHCDPPPRALSRDYHSWNIMVRPNGLLAMVDIQDARWGPDTYDLASLLRDAYVDLTEEEVDGLFRAFHEGVQDTAGSRERTDAIDFVAIQRMVKALGTFGYQVAVMNRGRYRTSILRTVERIRRLAPAHSELASIARSLELAPARRTQPWERLDQPR